MAGEHLKAFFGDAHKAVEYIPSIFRDAKAVPVLPEQVAHNARHNGEQHFLAVDYPATPASFLVLCDMDPRKENNAIVGFYPFLKDGVPHDLEILDLKPDQDRTEGVIEAVNRDAVTVTFYDPTFACHRDVYANGRKFKFSMAALAYCLEKVENTTFRITEGSTLEMERQRRLEEDPSADISAITAVEFSMANLRSLWPRDNGEDAEFQTVVESVDYFSVLGVEICKMNVVLMRPEEKDFGAILYASEYVLKGYRPQVGDSIHGVLWLQGYPLQPVDDPKNWGDRLTPDSPQYSSDGVMRASAVCDYLDDRHPGIIALGAGCAQEGWDVTKIENPDGSPRIPALYLERAGHRSINVWVLAYIAGQESPTLFTPDELAAYRAFSEKNNEDCAFVTVICTDIGKGHTFKAEGLETLEQYTGKLLLLGYLAKPEFRGPVELPDVGGKIE